MLVNGVYIKLPYIDEDGVIEVRKIGKYTMVRGNNFVVQYDLNQRIYIYLTPRAYRGQVRIE